MVTTPARFYENTERQGECLIWQGTGRIGPYGTVGFLGVQWLAHRLSFYFENGHIVDVEVVRHRCDTPLCVEPAHLQEGTHADNVADKVARRRHRFGEHHPSAKVTDVDVAEIRRRVAAGEQQKDVGLDFPLGKRQISRIVRAERRSA